MNNYLFENYENVLNLFYTFYGEEDYKGVNGCRNQINKNFS